MVAGRPSFRYQALIAFLTLLLLLVVLDSQAAFWRMAPGGRTLLFYALAAVSVSWLFWRVPWFTITAISLSILGGVIGLRYFPSWENYVRLIMGQWADFVESVRFNQLAATFDPSLGRLFLIGIALGLGMLVLRETLNRGSTFWSIAVGTMLFGIQWSWYYDPSFGAFAAYMVLAFLLWILGQASRRDALWAQSGRKIGHRSHVVTPLLGVLVIALIASLLPSSFAPVQLGAFGQRMQAAFPVLRQMRGAGPGQAQGLFSLRSTGFSSTMDSLGGPVRLDQTVALHMKTKKPLENSAYLRGATYQVYTGRTWSQGRSPFTVVPKESDIPSGYPSTVEADPVEIQITPALELGSTIFHLLEPVRVVNLKPDYQADADNNLWSERAIRSGNTYTVISRLPRFSSDHIRRVEALASADAFEAYLQLPASLPSRVGQLARRLTAEQVHPLDKALALERYIKTFPYALDVSPAPAGRDFVDFFLFDLQRGYCTYSATALAVMLRELSIPSRLVEGFAVGPSAQSTGGAADEWTYTVRNSQAHAWVEAYFTGYGWVPFDPTPRADLPGLDRSAPAPAPSLPGESSELEEALSGELPGDAPEPDFNQEFSGAALVAALPHSGRDWAWTLTLTLGVAGLLYAGFRRLRSGSRITATGSREVVQEAWTRSASLLSRFHLERKPHQTDREYAAELGHNWSVLKEPAMRVAEDYTAARFGPPGHPIDDEASRRARHLWDRVQELLFNRFGWRTYLWRRFRPVRRRPGD